MPSSRAKRLALSTARRLKDSHKGAVSAAGILGQDIHPEVAFHAILEFERRRAARSLRPFVLMLLDARKAHTNGDGASPIAKFVPVISGAIRETDLIGWYEQDVILGLIFTEVNISSDDAMEVLYSKLARTLATNGDNELTLKLVVTTHVYPEGSFTTRPKPVRRTIEQAENAPATA